MCKALDLLGKRFGKLTVIKRKGRTSRNRSVWLCQCDCGNKVVRVGSSLTAGRTKNCGCSRKIAWSSMIHKPIKSSYRPETRTVEAITFYCIYKDLRDEYSQYLDGDTMDSYYGTIYTWDVPTLNSLSREEQEALLISLRENTWEGDGERGGRHNL